MKHLYRSSKNKVWEGILGGFGQYFNVDPTIIRVFFVLFVMLTGILPGVIAYIIAIFIMPRQSQSSNFDYKDVQSDHVEDIVSKK